MPVRVNKQYMEASHMKTQCHPLSYLFSLLFNQPKSDSNTFRYTKVSQCYSSVPYHFSYLSALGSRHSHSSNNLVYEARNGTWFEDLAVRACGSILLIPTTSSDLCLINPFTTASLPNSIPEASPRQHPILSTSSLQTHPSTSTHIHRLLPTKQRHPSH